VADLLFFGLFFAAIVIGWVLGRQSRNAARTSAAYFSGRRAQDRPGERNTARPADTIVTDAGNTQTRIALGVQLRRRGEVDGAVRIHQELLTHTSLPRGEQAQTRLELARDYISAGLLDRAEELLLELVRESPQQVQAARRHLLEIYETERDWRRALEVALPLLPRKAVMRREVEDVPLERGQRVAQRLAHYSCELAEEERLGGNLEASRELLLDALGRDQHCVRASLLLGQVEYDAGRFEQGAQALRRVRVQDPDYLPETIDLLDKCYNALEDPQSLRDYLLDCLATRPTPALVAATADYMARTEGRAAAGEFLSAQLLEQPSLKGLSQLIGLKLAASAGGAQADLELLQGLSRKLLASGPDYRCGHCGFGGRHLHWQCPGCKQWGTMKNIDGPVAPWHQHP
jgi:lipopolysaccharide biosynthesis regulator YciM